MTDVTQSAITGMFSPLMGAGYRERVRRTVDFALDTEQMIRHRMATRGISFEQAKFDRKFEQMDKKFDGLRADVGALQVGVARIEGHLGLVVPAPTAPRAGSEPPERAA